MIGLALRSLRHRATALWATFTAVLLGSALMGSFATLTETATGPVPQADAETLTMIGGVVGAWGAVIVLFSVASTLGITVRQRETEIGLLRTVGATPRQARRLVHTEAAVVAFVAALAGALVAGATGRMLFGLLRDGGMVSPEVEYGATALAPAAAALVVWLTAMSATSIAARRATAGPATAVLRESAAEAGRMRFWRVTIALLLIAYGPVMAVVTVAVAAGDDDPYTAVATSGSSSILVGVGLAALAPWLLRLLATPLRPLVDHGAAGHLAAFTTARRAHLLSGVLAPVIVLTSAAIGTLMQVGIDRRTLDPALAAGEIGAKGETINLLNNVVVGMISLFAAIMVINAFAAVVEHRRAELRRLWLIGATPRQMRASIVAEAGVVALVGVPVGTVASLATVVPFALARAEGVVPDGQLWLPPLVMAGVAALTLAAARGTAGFAVRHSVGAR